MQVPERLQGVLSADELTSLVQRNNLAATAMIGANWGLIGLALALFAAWPNPLTAIVAVLLLGGRQLGLAVLNHDCAHNVMFTSRRANELIGHWLCGGPIHLSLHGYRRYHLKHHQFAGTEDDPDLALARTYPTSRASLRRKLLRDITGRTGWNDVRFRFRHASLRRHAPFLATHAVMLGLLTAAGAPWAYLAWWAAYLTTYQVVTRLRFMGEHAIVERRISDDPRENTTTTRVSLWERLLVAPNRVNYHLEHHLLAGVPPYHLPRLHRLLRERGYYDGHNCLHDGYLDVLRKAVRGDTPAPATA